MAQLEAAVAEIFSFYIPEIIQCALPASSMRQADSQKARMILRAALGEAV